jgi:ribonuclease J
LALVRPRYFVPVHGEYRHLVLHSRIAEEAGVPKGHIFILEDGQILEFGHFKESHEIEAQRGDQLPVGHVFVDGLGVGDVGNVVLRDRRHLSQDGFLVCVVAIDEVDGEIIYGPEIISRGFVYIRDSEDLISRARDVVENLLKKRVPVQVLENKIRDALTTFTYKEMGRRPMILPLVMEV